MLSSLFFFNASPQMLLQDTLKKWKQNIADDKRFHKNTSTTVLQREFSILNTLKQSTSKCALQKPKLVRKTAKFVNDQLMDEIQHEFLHARL